MKASGRWRRLRRLALFLAAAVVALTVLPVLVLRAVDPPTTAYMLRRQAQGRDEKGFTLRHQWVPLSRIAPALQLAFVAGEDQRFFQHHGFDLDAIKDALEDAEDGKGPRGASTLTQQVARNLFLWPRRSYLRKALEAYFTVLIELTWPKRRILEVHLNVAELGDGVYGVEAASRLYFGKPAATVSATEAALLAAVLPSPRRRSVTAPSPLVRERAAWIADQARRLGLDTLDGVPPGGR